MYDLDGKVALITGASSGSVQFNTARYGFTSIVDLKQWIRLYWYRSIADYMEWWRHHSYTWIAL